jgi:hypothetical protein
MCGIERWNGLSALWVLFGRQPGPLAQAGMATGLWPSNRRAFEIPRPPLEERRCVVAELDAEAEQMDSVRALPPRFEAKIQRVLDRVWGNGIELSEPKG